MSKSLFETKPCLTLAAAKKATDAAVSFAAESGFSMAVAVVDDGGNLLCLQRMDQAGYGCVDACLGKARSAAMFKTPTANFQEGLQSGVMSLLTLGVLAFGGGVPIEHGGSVVGAIGVGGGTPEQDIEAAKAGIAAITI